MQNVESSNTLDITSGGCNVDASSNPAGAPSGSDAPQVIISSCEELLESGDATAARQKLLLLDLAVPGDETEWKRLHSLCLALNDRTRAQLYTERFLRVNKHCAAAHLANARNFGSADRDRDRILEAVAAALRHPDPTVEFWREVARIQNGVHEHEAACESARKSISLDPSDVEMRELLISCLGVLRRTREIRTECEHLAHCLTGSRDPLRWACLARSAAEAGARKQAKAYINVAVDCLASENQGAEFELIRALILTKQAGRATVHLKHLIKGDSQNTWVWNTLLEMAMSRRYYEIALLVIARLKALPYQDPEFLYRLGLAEETASRSQRHQKNFGLRWLWHRIRRPW